VTILANTKARVYLPATAIFSFTTSMRSVQDSGLWLAQYAQHHSFSICIGLITSETNSTQAFSKSYDRLGFVKRVFVDNTIHLEITISVKEESKKSSYGTVTEYVEVFLMSTAK
jgi:hypothetical protein